MIVDSLIDLGAFKLGKSWHVYCGQFPMPHRFTTKAEAVKFICSLKREFLKQCKSKPVGEDEDIYANQNACYFEMCRLKSCLLDIAEQIGYVVPGAMEEVS